VDLLHTLTTSAIATIPLSAAFASPITPRAAIASFRPAVAALGIPATVRTRGPAARAVHVRCDVDHIELSWPCEAWLRYLRFIVALVVHRRESALPRGAREWRANRAAAADAP